MWIYEQQKGRELIKYTAYCEQLPILNVIQYIHQAFIWQAVWKMPAFQGLNYKLLCTEPNKKQQPQLTPARNYSEPIKVHHPEKKAKQVLSDSSVSTAATILSCTLYFQKPEWPYLLPICLNRPFKMGDQVHVWDSISNLAWRAHMERFGGYVASYKMSLRIKYWFCSTVQLSAISKESHWF